MSESEQNEAEIQRTMMIEFLSWLQDKGLSEATSKSYMTMARRMAFVWLERYRKNEELPVEEVFDHEENLVLTSARVFRVAWKQFCIFLQEQGITPPPTTEEVREKNHTKRANVMGSIGQYLAKNIKRKTDLVQLQWGMVKRGHDCVTVNYRGEMYIYYGSRAKLAFNALGRWGHGTEHPMDNAPLFPVRKGELGAMSAVRLAKLMAESVKPFGHEDMEENFQIPRMLIETLVRVLESGVSIEEVEARLMNEPLPVVGGKSAPAESEKTLDSEAISEVERPSTPKLELPPMPTENTTFMKWLAAQQPKG